MYRILITNYEQRQKVSALFVRVSGNIFGLSTAIECLKTVRFLSSRLIIMLPRD